MSDAVQLSAFDPAIILGTLNEEGVDYLVIGGMAALMHGSAVTTEDVDILPSRDDSNLDRLARALKRLNAQIRTVDGPVPTHIDGPFLAAMPHMLNLVTDAGDLDLTFTPAGPLDGYDGWSRKAIKVDVDGLTVPVASLDDVIDSKAAANRPKDVAALPYLEEVRRRARGGQ